MSKVEKWFNPKHGFDGLSMPAIQSQDGWNPYFAAYASAKGRSCEEQIKRDRKRYPAAPALPFLMWMSDVRIAFGRAHPEALGKHGMITDLDLFARFVGEWAEANA